MIQRIQTVWLLLVVICGILLMTGTIVTFSGEAGLSYSFGFRGLEEFSGEIDKSVKASPALQIALIGNVITALVAIFLFGRRRLQKSLALISAIVSLMIQAFVIFIAYRTITDSGVLITGWVKAGLPLVMTVASLLAWKGIDRDEKKVKSYDRLR